MKSAPQRLDIIVVEDEAMVAMLVEDMLADLGHNVIATVGRLDQATKLITDAKFDFAILDVNLNGEDTYSLAELLRERRVPFAFATGYGSSGLDPRWRGIPALQKPFQSEQLEKLIADNVSGTIVR